MNNHPRATIEPMSIPLFRDIPEKWSIIFHTSSGREEFGIYRTKKAAREDAKRYDIKISS